MDEGAVHVAVNSIVHRAEEIQQSIQLLLSKLELQERLDWPDMLQSYMVLAGQFESLMKVLRKETASRGDEGPRLKNLALVPSLLSMDLDPELQKLTEGRLERWSHEVVPDYLRTKPDRSGEDLETALRDKAAKYTPEQALKQVNTLNKHLDHFSTSLSDIIRQEASDAGSQSKTYNDDDTRALVAAISRGEGLPRQQAPAPPPAAAAQAAVSSAQTPQHDAAAAMPAQVVHTPSSMPQSLPPPQQQMMSQRQPMAPQQGYSMPQSGTGVPVVQQYGQPTPRYGQPGPRYGQMGQHPQYRS